VDEYMGEIVSVFFDATPGHYFDKEALFSYPRERLSPQKHQPSGVRQANFLWLGQAKSRDSPFANIGWMENSRLTLKRVVNSGSIRNEPYHTY